MLKKILLFLIILGSLFPVFPCFAENSEEGEAQEVLDFSKVPQEHMIAIMTSAILTKQHYLKKEFNAEFGKEFLADYLNTLDPRHMFFTQPEVDVWRRHENELVQKLQDGDLVLPYGIFNVFYERLLQYEKYVKSLKLEDKDFETSDMFEIDRSKAPWPANEKEQKKLWYDRVRNDIILYRMMRQVQEMPSEDGSEEKEKPGLWKTKTPMERVYSRADQMVQMYRAFKPIDILELYLNAYTHRYDPHTDYLAPKSNEDFNINMKLKLLGIGAVLQTADDGSVKIVSIIPGGPAEKEGSLKAGDRIIAVAQGDNPPVDVIDMNLDKVVSMIRGEPGTVVVITAWDAAAGSSAPPKTVRITREEVVIKDSEAKGEVREVPGPDGKVHRIAVITLPSFYMDFDAVSKGDPDYKSSTRDVQKLLRELKKGKGFEALVMDLRANGGGSLHEAITLTGLFIKEGPVVQTKTSAGTITVESDTDGGQIAYSGPLIVLVNRLSASASEIFAGAIHDYNRGVIVGDMRTHGKGTVQTILDLNTFLAYLGCPFNGGAVKLTNMKFYRVNGASTQLKGVEPDIVFPSFTDVMDLGEEKLQNAMPWDTIAPAPKVTVWDASLPAEIQKLRNSSMKRMEADPLFNALKKDIERSRLKKEEKFCSLNYDKRWKEFLEEKKLLDEQQKLLKLDSESPKEETKKNKERDLFLEETMRIAVDYAADKTGKDH